MVFFANIQVLVIFSYTYFAFVDFADTQFMTKPASSVTHCSGTELEMEWTYPETDLDRILWQKASTSILIIGNTDNVISTTNVLEHVAKGKVKISSPTISDSGVYSVSVDYVFGSGTPSLTDTLTLTIQDAPAGLAFTVSSDTYTCTSTSLGTPAADLLIKVNDVLQTGSTYTSTSNSDNIECCFNGTAVTCIAGATNPYCIVAKIPAISTTTSQLTTSVPTNILSSSTSNTTSTENRDDGGTGGTGSSGDTGGAVAMSLKDKEKLPPIKEKKTAFVRPQPTVVSEDDERSLPVPPSGPKTRGLSANFEEFPNMPSKKLAPIELEKIIEEEEDRKKKKKKKKKSRKIDDDEQRSSQIREKDKKTCRCKYK